MLIKKMISEKYYLTSVDVLGRIKEIHDEIDGARKLLAETKVDELAKENKKISGEIDDLYDVLAKEYKARPFVEKIKVKC